MIIDIGEDIVKEVTLKDLTKEIEQGDGALRRGISLVFTSSRMGMILVHFQGEGKCRSLKAKFKMSAMRYVIEGEGLKGII